MVANYNVTWHYSDCSKPCDTWSQVKDLVLDLIKMGHDRLAIQVTGADYDVSDEGVHTGLTIDEEEELEKIFNN